uniref:Uncharacterized protein n=1 Tax=Arundo donax TaxID=35708 RepID=A0A0A9DZS0_ARUDO
MSAWFGHGSCHLQLLQDDGARSAKKTKTKRARGSAGGDKLLTRRSLGPTVEDGTRERSLGTTEGIATKVIGSGSWLSKARAAVSQWRCRRMVSLTVATAVGGRDSVFTVVSSARRRR